jgi:phage terminase large subunit
LPASLVAEIERIKEQDEAYWKIYGLGERAAHGNTIYLNWDLCDILPDGETFYGLDFGYNDPSALIRVTVRDGELYEHEVVYETRLTNSELIERLKAGIENKSAPIYCDGAEPDRIMEICQAGFNAIPADKGKESVRNSIDTVKRYKVHIQKDSSNLIREKRNWKWREDKNGKPLDEPVGINDHAMAAERYAIHTHLRKEQFSVLFEA